VYQYVELFVLVRGSTISILGLSRQKQFGKHRSTRTKIFLCKSRTGEIHAIKVNLLGIGIGGGS
jgi:hypothetical protein